MEKLRLDRADPRKEVDSPVQAQQQTQSNRENYVKE